jgi:hypothetical protein
MHRRGSVARRAGRDASVGIAALLAGTGADGGTRGGPGQRADRLAGGVAAQRVGRRQSGGSAGQCANRRELPAVRRIIRVCFIGFTFASA